MIQSTFVPVRSISILIYCFHISILISLLVQKLTDRQFVIWKFVIRNHMSAGISCNFSGRKWKRENLARTQTVTEAVTAVPWKLQVEERKRRVVLVFTPPPSSIFPPPCQGWEFGLVKCPDWHYLSNGTLTHTHSPSSLPMLLRCGGTCKSPPWTCVVWCLLFGDIA